MDSTKVAAHCLVQQKKIISKLYQIQIKAVNHALNQLGTFETEGQPAKVIEFIKKWVAKEKVLISHYVKQLITNDGTYQSNIRIEESQIYLKQEMAARKNREQYASRVNHVDNKMRGGRDLNLSKESDDLADGAYAKAAMEMGSVMGYTQDNFYKAPTDNGSPWKPGDHSMS